MRAILKLVLVWIVILGDSLAGAIEDDSDSAHQAADMKAGADGKLSLCMLSGKVVSFDTGEPVPYFHLLHMGKSGGLIEHLETDEQGSFHTTAPRGSERYFQFDRSRRGTYIIDWDRQRQIGLRPFHGVVREDISDLVFKVGLWPVRVLTGRVLDRSGQAVADASVYIHCDVPAVKTDASGTFNIQVVPTDRDFDLFAVSEDMNQAESVHLKAGTTSATIRLETTLSYRGRVIDTTCKPVGPFKFLIGLRPNGSDADCLQREIQADTDGTFTIDYLCPKANYYAWWFPDEQINRTIGEFGSKTVDLTGHKPEEPIEIVVEQYLNTVSGRVVNAEAEPIAGARIMVGTTHGIQASYRQHRAVFTGEEGRFSLPNLANGQVLFNVYAKGYKSRRIWASTDAANLEIILKSPSETSICEVWVVDDENRPVPNAPVNLYFSVTEAGQEVITSHTATTNAAGKAEFKIKPFGENLQVYGIICCNMNGYDLAYNSVSHQADSQVKLVLHKAGECWSGKIVDPQQSPVAGAKLYLTSMSQRTRTPRRTTIQWLDQSSFWEQSELTLLAQTDANGEFVLQRFNKKDFVRVVVKAPGFKRQEIDFSPEWDAGTVFELSVGVAVVKGLLISESASKPMPHASIQLRAYKLPERDVVTDESGSFIIEDLEPGEYVPVFQSPKGDSGENYVCVPESFVAEAGKTLEVTLKVQRGIPVEGRLVESKTQKRPTARRIYLDARAKSGQTVASDDVEPDGTWQLLLPAGSFEIHCSILMEESLRFIDSEKPVVFAAEKGKIYEDLALEITEQGHLVMQPSSLTGKVLPTFDDLGVDFTAEQVEGKPILVCFWDMNQRPSRNSIRQLAEQAEQLKQKGITVVAVQASKVDEDTLNKWVKDNSVSFPVGMIEGDAEKIRFAWGVRALPWLILTDRQHVVKAVGFGLDELSQKIAAIGPKED
jgi:hypothetical protein